MTDLATLALPAWAVPTRPRVEAVDGHWIDIRQHWWRERISALGLPGVPPSGPILTRADVWAPTDDVFTLKDKCGWTSLNHTWGWSGDTYQRYCDLLARWAKEHQCAADELERSLFKP
ncbi:hypothetical protein [Actinocrispum sp. NPDC049592]|uniref:8-oxoguanine DNA glycosylase OGG fold protein n=1 Tax=Actinocrispum sp. NPDC049592 TaxID=3154835 RepID=UPI00343D1269